MPGLTRYEIVYYPPGGTTSVGARSAQWSCIWKAMLILSMPIETVYHRMGINPWFPETLGLQKITMATVFKSYVSFSRIYDFGDYYHPRRNCVKHE